MMMSTDAIGESKLRYCFQLTAPGKKCDKTIRTAFEFALESELESDVVLVFASRRKSDDDIYSGSNCRFHAV